MAKAYYDVRPTLRQNNDPVASKRIIFLNVLGGISLVILVCILLSSLIYFIISFNQLRSNIPQFISDQKIELDNLLKFKQIVVVTNLCGDKSDLLAVLALIKSIIIFSQPETQLFFILLTDRINVLNGIDFNQQIFLLPEPHKSRVRIQTRSIGVFNPILIGLFTSEKAQLCSVISRLFLPELLPEIDNAIYLDPNSLFLSPIEPLWDEFERMEETQMIGFSSRNNMVKSYYNNLKGDSIDGGKPITSPVSDQKMFPHTRKFHTPNYYPFDTNLNEVLLLNLTRLRANTLNQKMMTDVYQQIKRIKEVMNPTLLIGLGSENTRDNFISSTQKPIQLSSMEAFSTVKELGCQWDLYEDDIKHGLKSGCSRDKRTVKDNDGSCDVNGPLNGKRKGFGVLHYKRIHSVVDPLVQQINQLICNFDIAKDQIDSLVDSINTITSGRSGTVKCPELEN